MINLICGLINAGIVVSCLNSGMVAAGTVNLVAALFNVAIFAAFHRWRLP